MVGDDDEDHQTPGKLGHQVSGGTPDAKQADQVGNNGGYEDRAHQGNVAVKFRTHISPDEIDQSIVDHFRHSLLAGDAGHFQTGTQPDTQGGNDDHDQPGGSQGLCDLNGTEQGYIFECGKNSRTIDFYCHFYAHLII